MVAVCVCAVCVCGAKVRSTRAKLQCDSDAAWTQKVAPEQAVIAVADTLRDEAAARVIAVSGYEKPLRSRHETMLVTNRDSALTVTSVSLDITYTDMQGRTLHKRTATASLTLPPGTTRLLDIKSWDVNQLFYYHINVPARTSSQATPYRVLIAPKAIITSKSE
jgi:hypothetical protein